MNRNLPRLGAAILISLLTAPTHAAGCAAESGARRVALLELYTSEGCNSCPPADRWVSGLAERGYTPERVVALAFHVDYWNYLGWPDPFSRAQYSERQRMASLRNRARVIYTPQLLLNGRDYRRGLVFDDIGERLDALSRDTARAAIRLQLRTEDPRGLAVTGTATVAEVAARGGAQAFLGLYENDLSNEVTAGENRGKRLRHDFVVRELAGPFPVDAGGEARLRHHFNLEPRWKPGHLHVAAFVQNERSGDVLQSLALPVCR
ncbi:MAG: DUF1223 domain-containing protein [Burkholderiales bacterium]